LPSEIGEDLFKGVRLPPSKRLASLSRDAVDVLVLGLLLDRHIHRGAVRQIDVAHHDLAFVHCRRESQHHASSVADL
jgi:hypothetical protein